MRAMLLFCTGCVISAPEGAPQTWPPTLGGTVEAVVAGDLDANGSSEIIVAMSGTANQAGLYYLTSDPDLMWDSGDVVRSFSRFVPLALVRPTALFLDAAPPPRLYAVTGTETLAVRQLSNTLQKLEIGDTTVAGGGSAWLRPITFPGAQVHYAVSNGSTIDHLESSFETPRPLPAPMSQAWTHAQTVTSYADGTAQVAVVATSDMIYRSSIPTTQGSPFAWESVRTSTRPWLGQVPLDLDGDGRAEIIGFDLAAQQVCVVDPGTAVLPVVPSCIQLSSTFTGTDVTIIAGVNLSSNAVNDILVVQTGGSETTYSLAEDVVYAAGTLTASMVKTIPVTGPPRGKTIVATPGLARPHSVLTFGADGRSVCALGPC